MGLKDLAKKDVENIFSYVLSKYPSVNDFLMNFDTILKKLYEHKDYTGGWDQKKVDGLIIVFRSVEQPKTIRNIQT